MTKLNVNTFVALFKESMSYDSLALWQKRGVKDINTLKHFVEASAYNRYGDLCSKVGMCAYADIITSTTEHLWNRIKDQI